MWAGYDSVLRPACARFAEIIYPEINLIEKSRENFKAFLSTEQKNVWDKTVFQLFNEFNTVRHHPTNCLITLNIVFRKPLSWTELSDKVSAISCPPSDIAWKDQLIGYLGSMIIYAEKMNGLYKSELKSSDTQKQQIRSQIDEIQTTVARVLKHLNAHLKSRPQAYADIEKYFRENLDFFMLFNLWKDVSPTSTKWPSQKDKSPYPEDLFYVRVKHPSTDEQLKKSIVAHFQISETDFIIETIGNSAFSKTRRIELKENSLPCSIAQIKPRRDSASSLHMTEKMPGASVEDEKYTFMYNFAFFAVDEVNMLLGNYPDVSSVLKEMRRSPKPPEEN